MDYFAALFVEYAVPVIKAYWLTAILIGFAISFVFQPIVTLKFIWAIIKLAFVLAGAILLALFAFDRVTRNMAEADQEKQRRHREDMEYFRSQSIHYKGDRRPDGRKNSQHYRR